MTDVYKVGVSLVMTGNYAQVLGALGQQLLGVNAKVKDLEGSFGRLKIAITGALAVFGSVKVLETMGTMVKYGDQLVHQQNLLAAAGASQKEIAEATAKAYQTSAQIQTTSIAESLRHLRELRYAFGDINKAMEANKVVEQANAVMGSVGGHDYSDQVWDIVKSLEMTNKTLDIGEFSSYVDTLTKLYTASGGKITPQQIFQSFKYGRTAALGWDQEFIGGALGRAIQSLGGGSGGGGGRAGPGNALMSAYQAIVQDQMTKKAAQQFGGLGLYEGKSVEGSDLFMHNPYEWVQQILMPALKAKGITSQDAVLAEISKLFPNRTASQIMSEFATQGRFMRGDESMYEKDIRLQGGAMGYGAFGMLMNKDYQTNLKAFNEQWNSLMQSLGSAMVPPAIEVLKTFTGAFTSLTHIAGENPERVRQVAEVIGALAAALAAIGTAAIVAVLAPLVGTGGLIAGLAVALIALGKVDFLGITTKLDNLEKGFQSFGEKLRNLFKNGLPEGMMPGGASYYGGAHYQPISYTTYGNSGGGGPGYDYSYGGSGDRVASAPSGGGVASPSFGGVGRAALGGVASAPKGDSIASPPNPGAMPMGGNIPAGVTGNAYVAARRAGFAKQLQDPNVRMQVAGMLLTEGTPLPTVESLFNRSEYAGKSLMQMLHSGFYGPINRGQLAGAMARLRRNPKLLAKMDSAIDAALAGSDIIHGATDQGMPTDPNGRWPGGRIHIGGNIFNDWGGGPGGHGGAAAWRRHFEEGRLNSRPPDMYGVAQHNPAYSAWQWHHNFSSGHSAVPDNSGGHEVHVHHTTNLDGRVISQNVAKHFVRHGNMASGSGRMADLALTRPTAI